MERPDLTKLTEQQKDNLIVLLFDYIERLESRVKELEERLSKNSNKTVASHPLATVTKSQIQNHFALKYLILWKFILN